MLIKNYSTGPALRRKRKVAYDVKAEQFVGDNEANRRLQLRSLRAPWQA